MMQKFMQPCIQDIKMNKKDFQGINSIPDFVGSHAINSLNEIFNQRKHKEGLISVQNSLIFDLQKVIECWVKKENDNFERIEHIELKSDEMTKRRVVTYKDKNGKVSFFKKKLFR